jgi:CRISPR type IV-associated protein Csf2
MSKIIINATLTTVQPVSIKLPDQDGHPTMTMGLDTAGMPLKTAYIPATTVRGKLRRLAVAPLMQAAAKNGKPWTLQQVYESMLGQDAASEASEEIDLLALKKRREGNHIVDLFGAGLGVKSRLSVGHFVPAVQVQPESFAGVRKDLDSDTDVLDLMDSRQVDAFVNRNINNSNRSAQEKVLKDLTRQLRKAEKDKTDSADLQEALNKAQIKLAELEQSMGEMKNSTKTLTSYQALPAGVQLQSRMIIDKATQKDLHVLLDALNLFSQTPVLGGQTARGCGEVKGRFEVFDSDGSLLGVLQIGDYKKAEMSWTEDGKVWNQA